MYPPNYSPYSAPTGVPGYGYNPYGYGYDVSQSNNLDRIGYPGYYYNLSDQLEPQRNTVSFGGFSAGQLATTGIISYAIVRLLGASVPGAIAMGIGNILWEAGSPAIPAGWKRYVLGLFRKPEA